MKRVALKHRLIAFSAIVTMAFAGERVLGPEWEKQTFPNTDYVEYRRVIKVPVTRSGSGNVSNYRVPLNAGEVLVSEIDDNAGLIIRYQGPVALSAYYGKDGTPVSYEVTLGNMTHHDLNGDGHIDARFDGILKKSFVLYKGEEIEVNQSKDGFKGKRKRSVRDKTWFVFQDGAWVIKE